MNRIINFFILFYKLIIKKKNFKKFEIVVSTCNAITGERQEIWVFEAGKLVEQRNGVVVENVSGVFEDFDCDVDVTGEYGPVNRATPTFS